MEDINCGVETHGQPLMEYLLAWRMATAKDLLRRRDLTLSEVTHNRRQSDLMRLDSGHRTLKDATMKTVLITGCSSGYGWNVIATMRTPRSSILPDSDRLRLLPLDVTRPESIAAALDSASPIDVLVNNAGIGLIGALEATPMSKTRQVFETNTFGVIAMTQAFVPQFRARRSGVIVNVTSSATLAPMPLASIYTASKMAIEGFTGSLEHELRAFNVRVKLVEPGYGPTTRFTQNTDVRLEDVIPEPYAAFAQPILAALAQPGLVTTEADVAEAVWRAANDESGQLRFPAGPDALALVRA
jgi:short-subunit dehydrogenase